MAERIFRVLLFPFLAAIPLVVFYDFIIWIKTGTMKDNGRCFLCYVAFGKWKELI